MKKLLLGCGVIALLILLAIVGIGTFFVSAGRKMTAEIRVAQTSLDGTNTEFAFTPPADGLLQDERLKTWIGAAKSIADFHDKQTSDLGRGGGFNAMRAGLRLVPETMEHTAAALRQAKMSETEYRWIRDQIQAALVSAEARAIPEILPLAVALGANAATSATATNPAAPVDIKVVSLTAEQKKHLADLVKSHVAELQPLIAPIFRTPIVDGLDFGRTQGMARRGGGW